jgi:hypothetical protein
MTRSLGAFVGLMLLAFPAAAGGSHGGGGPRDFTVGGGTNTNELGGRVQIGFAAHRGAPGFAGLVPSGEELLRVGDFAGPATSVTEIAHIGAGATGHEVAKGDLDGDGPLPPFKFEGPVTCLTVDRSRASFFYEFKHAEPVVFEGGGIQVYVEDNGPPWNGQGIDATAFDPPIPGPGPGMPPLEGPTVCPPPRPGGYDRQESGNLVVHDATP